MSIRENAAPLRLLLADNDPNFLATFRQLAETATYWVAGEAKDAREALRIAQRSAPAVALVSADLPFQEGFALAERLQGDQIAPVVLLTQQITPERVRAAASIGVYSFLEKPLRVANLVPAIEIAHSNWQAAQMAKARLRRLEEQERVANIIENAKRELMSLYGISEPRAYRIMQKRSMNSRTPMRDVALSVLRLSAQVEDQESLSETFAVTT